MLPTVRVEEKPGYLHVTVTGENSPENVFHYLMEVRNACVSRRYSAVLIEENLSGAGLSLRSIFDVVSEAGAKTPPTLKRIAYVDVNTEHDPVRMKFAENVASDLGISVRVFFDLRAAEQWLLDSGAPPDSTGIPPSEQSGHTGA